MTILAEVVRDGDGDPIARVKLAGVPRVGDTVLIENDAYTVRGVTYLAFNADANDPFDPFHIERGAMSVIIGVRKQ